MQSSHKKTSAQFEDTTYLYSADKSLIRAQTEDYLNRTPVRNQYTSSANKNKNKNSRTSQAKRAIDDVIGMIADKKRMNQEAISQIKNVNSQIVNNLTGTANRAKIEQKRKTSEQFKNTSNVQNISTSLFDWRNSHNQLQNSQKQSEASEQNLILRSRLNQQIRRNNQLFQYIASLQQENSLLKSSSRDQGRDSVIVSSLVEENRRLREQINAQQGSGLYEELLKLKEENTLLRKETISLLKNKST